MPKYRVTIPYAVHVTTEVEAEDEEFAIDEALKNKLSLFCGNNAWDRMCGVTDGSIDVDEEPIDDNPFVPEIEVEEVEG